MDYLEDYIQLRYSTLSSVQWLDRYWYIPLVSSLLYVIFLYVGTRWMKYRRPYNLRPLLMLWNVGLAIFSMLIFWRSEVLGIVRKMAAEGIEEVSCNTNHFDDPRLVIWAFLFTFFKLIELGDTVFIVFRKTSLNFLHWYHHITVLVYSWYIVPQKPAPAILFLAMNTTIHSIMYSYYAVKAAGYRVPSQVAMVITILQILQMIGGIVFNITAFNVLQRGDNCQFSYTLFVIGMMIYTSYLILFGNFFYRQYFKNS